MSHNPVLHPPYDKASRAGYWILHKHLWFVFFNDGKVILANKALKNARVIDSAYLALKQWHPHD